MSADHTVSAIFETTQNTTGNGNGGSSGGDQSGASGHTDGSGPGPGAAKSTPPAPRCAVSFPTNRILLRNSAKHRTAKHRNVKPRTLTAKVTCNQAVTVTLAGKLSTTGRSGAHRKAKTSVMTLSRVRAKAPAAKPIVLIVNLPRAAITALTKAPERWHRSR